MIIKLGLAPPWVASGTLEIGPGAVAAETAVANVETKEPIANAIDLAEKHLLEFIFFPMIYRSFP